MSPKRDAVFSGSCTALVTPFSGGRVDKKAFCKLVEWQIENGTAALIPVGTTGESPTLSHEEHDIVVDLCIKQAAGRVPIIAGAGSNSTAEAVRLAKHAAEADACGIDCQSLLQQAYSRRALSTFFCVAAAVSVPVIVYDIPGRSIVQVTEETHALQRLPNIRGIKDATADVARPTRIRNLLVLTCATIRRGCFSSSIPCCRWAWLYFGYGECCSKIAQRYAQGLGSWRYCRGASDQ